MLGPRTSGRHVPSQRLRLYPPALTRKLLRPPYGRAASAPGPPGKEFATLTSTLRPSGRCRVLRYAPAAARPERLRSYLQGRPRPGPLRRASSRSVLATLRAARLQARRIHPSRPRSAAHIECRRILATTDQAAPSLHVLRFASGVRAYGAHVSSAHPPQAAPGAQAVPVGRPSTSSGPPPGTACARRRPVGSCLPPRFAQFQAGPSLNRRCRYAFARKLARCRAASRAGLRCGGSSPLAASSHNAAFCSLRRSPLRPSLVGGRPLRPRPPLLRIHPHPEPSRKLLLASARRCRTSAQLPRRPRGRLRFAPPQAVATLARGVRSWKALLSFPPLPRSG